MRHLWYKCNKCRTRHKFTRPPEWYKVKRKCVSCGHGRFYEDKYMNTRREGCYCGSTHYPHRFGSNVCSHHPDYEVYVRTKRYGETLSDVLLDIAWNRPVPVYSDVAPF